MKRRQTGAALLLAMIILTLVSTLAAGMVWHQHRAIEVETAERARSQAEWILNGALDWSRLILREDANSDARTGQKFDHLGEPWATPLEEARLSTFLAADKDNNADSGPEAFLSGAIVDAQSHYNLRNLLAPDGTLVPAEVAGLQRLCDAIGVGPDVAELLGQKLKAAWTAAGGDTGGDTPLAPGRIAELSWLGIDEATLGVLERYVRILPTQTPININTAPREVLVAGVDNLDLASAERVVQARQRQPLKTLEDLRSVLALPPEVKIDEKRVGVGSRYFEVYGRLRLEQRVVEERSLVERKGPDRGAEVTALQRERRNLSAVTR